jgi:sulfoxide reductase heme-binding subunit YedZ
VAARAFGHRPGFDRIQVEYIGGAVNPAVVLLGAASNGKALWYLTRATGIVALVLLTATVVIGVVASVGWTTERWPRFLSQTVHRNLSLFCLGFVAVHVVSTVSDGYVPIGFADAFVPFLTPYRPICVGLGALAFDLLLAVMITSALRHRIGFSAWRFVHWLAYLCWPIAMFHSLGSGSDASLSLVLFIDALCAAAVISVVAWRVVTGRTFALGRRAAAVVGTVIISLALVVFAALGPLRPGWSLRAGTSTALLAQLARKNTASNTANSSLGSSAPAPTTGTVPPAPFTFDLTGSQTTSGPDSQGNMQVTLTMQLQNPSSTPLTVVLNGIAAQGGGIDMSSGTVDFGGYHGAVTGLSGGSLVASVAAPSPESLALSLNVDQVSLALSGTVSGTVSQSGGSNR